MLGWLGRYIPYVETMRGYNAAALRSDAVAALTVAIVAVPQSMAYAVIVGVDPVYGLYTSIVAAMVGAFFGSSNHLITGPTNASALMIAGAMQRHVGTPDFYPMLFLLTFLVGAIRLLFGILRVGRIVNFVSHAVIVGFTAGAGTIIGLGQLSEWLGVTLPKGYHPLYEKVWLTLTRLGEANPYSVGLGILAVAILWGAKRIDRRLPGALLALVVTALLARFLHLGDHGVKLVGAIPTHLPTFSRVPFNLEWAHDLFNAALALAIVGLVEALAIAKSIALSSGQRVDANQELCGQGLANIVGSFFGCFPSSGSFTRSAINFGAGARTPTAGILSGVFVAVVLVCFADSARYIPMASLAGVIIVVAYGMVDRKAIARIRRASRHDLGVLLITTGATVIMPDLEHAILTGVAVSVLVHVWNTGETKIRLLRPYGNTFREHHPDGTSHGATPIVIVHFDGNLYFGSAQDLQDNLRQVSELRGVQVFILRLKRVNGIDISAFEILDAFIDKAHACGQHVLLCGVNPNVERFIRKTGLAARLGDDGILAAEDTLFASTQKAYLRAQALLASPTVTA